MTIRRLPDDLGHMRQAIADAQWFIEGMAQADFEQDMRTQQSLPGLITVVQALLGEQP